jgi:hypothetical protein
MPLGDSAGGTRLSPARNQIRCVEGNDSKRREKKVLLAQTKAVHRENVVRSARHMKGCGEGLGSYNKGVMWALVTNCLRSSGSK